MAAIHGSGASLFEYEPPMPYLGKSDAFDKAIAEFSIAYADQSEHRP